MIDGEADLIRGGDSAIQTLESQTSNPQRMEESAGPERKAELGLEREQAKISH